MLIAIRIEQRKTYNSDKIPGYDLVESIKQIFDLILDRRVKPVLRGKLDIFWFVLMRNLDLFTTFF